MYFSYHIGAMLTPDKLASLFLLYTLKIYSYIALNVNRFSLYTLFSYDQNSEVSVGPMVGARVAVEGKNAGKGTTAAIGMCVYFN